MLLVVVYSNWYCTLVPVYSTAFNMKTHLMLRIGLK